MEGNPSKKELAKLWGSDPVHLTTAGYQKMADKLVELAEAHQMKPPKTTDTAKTKQTNRQTTERRPGLSRSNLTAGRWGQDNHHQSNRSGRNSMPDQPSGKRRYSGGNQPSKKRV